MLFALTLLGCSAWIDQEAACDQDVYYWSDDLLAYIMEGDGSGEFEFDPVDTPRTNLMGIYAAEDGDFAWVASYDQGYYLRKSEVQGFGTVFHNGNLDLLFTETVTDMLGDVFVSEHRVQRTGCNMTVASWPEDGSVDDAILMEGSYQGGSKWAWAFESGGYDYSGELRSDLTRTTVIEGDDYDYETVAGPDGITTGEFDIPCGDTFTCEGTSTRNFDGSLDEHYQVLDDGDDYAEVTTELDYDGSGVITYEFEDGPTCEYTYDEDGDCEYECDDDTDGDC